MPQSDLFSLDGRLALVTGSSRGIGLALAEALGQAGATVVLNGRDQEALAGAHQRLRASGLDVHARICDVADPGAVEELIESIETELGPLEILVNNAGAQQRAPFLEFPLDGFRRLLEVNLVAPFLLSQAAGRRMVERNRGKIVNVCSVQSQLGRATIAPYAATKGGLKMLTRALCAELGPRGIQVNGLAPGYLATDLNRDLVDDPDFSEWVTGRTPARRWGEVGELGGAAVFLCSDASSFVNGQILFVDGGMTAVV
jgi:gluconate 5-dehydrogenase